MENNDRNQGYQNYGNGMEQGQSYQNQGYATGQDYQNGQWQQYSNGPYQNWQNPPEKKGFAVASLVLGILSIVCCFFYSGILGIVGIILGIISCVKKEGGRGMAIGGIITSAIGTVILIIEIIVVVFAFQMGKELYEANPEALLEQLEELEEEYNLESDNTEYAIGENEITVTLDEFAGKTFVAGDSSVIYFKEDGTFVWYQDDSNHEDYYYEGTYSVHMGDEACDYIMNDLSEYGVTQEKLDDYFAMNSDSDFYTKDCFTCLTLHTECKIVEGENEVEEAYDKHYMGFFADGYYDAANMDSAEYVSFTERTE